MASQNQIAANRRNAALSTGPRTPEGKARSARNATRLGLLSRDTVLPEEDPQAFNDLVADLDEHFNPADVVERFLVRDIASAQWRLQRVIRIETGYYTIRMEQMYRLDHDEPPPRPKDPYDAHTRLFGNMAQRGNSDTATLLLRQENSLRRAWYKAVDALEKHRRQNEPNPPETDPEPRPAEPPAPPAPPAETAPARRETGPKPAIRSLFLLPAVASARPRCTPLRIEPCGPAVPRPSACRKWDPASLAAA